MIKFLLSLFTEEQGSYFWLCYTIARCLYILTPIVLFLVFGIKLCICRKKKLKLRISNIIICFLSGSMLFLMFGINNSMSMKNKPEVFELLSQVEITDEVKTFFSLRDYQSNREKMYPENFYVFKSSAEYGNGVCYYDDKKRASLYNGVTSLIEFSSNDEAQSAFKYITQYPQRYLDNCNSNKDVKLYKLSDGTEYMLTDLTLMRTFPHMEPAEYRGYIMFVKNNYIIIIFYSQGCAYNETYFLSIPVKPNRKNLMKNIENTIMDTLINPVADPDEPTDSEY